MRTSLISVIVVEEEDLVRSHKFSTPSSALLLLLASSEGIFVLFSSSSFGNSSPIKGKSTKNSGRIALRASPNVKHLPAFQE